MCRRSLRFLMCRQSLQFPMCPPRQRHLKKRIRKFLPHLRLRPFQKFHHSPNFQRFLQSLLRPGANGCKKVIVNADSVCKSTAVSVFV